MWAYLLSLRLKASIRCRFTFSTLLYLDAQYLYLSDQSTVTVINEQGFHTVHWSRNWCKGPAASLRPRVGSLLDLFFLSLKDITFRCCFAAVDNTALSLLLVSSTYPVAPDFIKTQHTKLSYTKFWLKALTFLVQKYNSFVCQTVVVGIFLRRDKGN